MTSVSGYTLFDHTADAGLRAWGPDPPAAFAQAARGMFALMLGTDPWDLAASGRADETLVEVEGQEWDDLLVNWLAGLLFHFETEGLVPIQVEFAACSPPRCASRVQGTRLTDQDDITGVGVKAITYHELRVRVGDGTTELQVIFDI